MLPATRPASTLPPCLQSSVFILMVSPSPLLKKQVNLGPSHPDGPIPPSLVDLRVGL